MKEKLQAVQCPCMCGDPVMDQLISLRFAMNKTEREK